MLECIVIQFAIAINIHTQEAYDIYRCQGEKTFKYLKRDKEFKGIYDIDNNVFIITDERKGV